ncbi:MAG: hypothetical protein ACOY94_07715, partial [Bacillota bacterium]
MPVLGIFLASVLIAISHGLVSPVITPHYWIVLGLMAVIFAGSALPDWWKLSPIWRIPLLLASAVYASALLVYSGKLSYLGMLYILPVSVASLMLQGTVRHLLQGVIVLMGVLAGSWLHRSVPWDWLLTLGLMTISSNYLIDRILLTAQREANRARHFRVIAETAQLLLVRSGDDMLKMFCQQALTAFNCTQCVLFLASE